MFDRDLHEMTRDRVDEQEQARLQQAQANREAQEQEARALEARREERLTREAYENLSPEEHAQFDQIADPVNVVTELSRQALNQVIQKFNATNAAQRQKELAELRNKPYIDKAAAIQEINRRADERAAAFKKALEDRELQSEKHGDPIQRAIAALPDEARSILIELLDKRPKTLDVIQSIKAGSGNTAHATQQDQLYQLYKAELGRAGRNPTAARLLRAKYRGQGLEV